MTWFESNFFTRKSFLSALWFGISTVSSFINENKRIPHQHPRDVCGRQIGSPLRFRFMASRTETTTESQYSCERLSRLTKSSTWWVIPPGCTNRCLGPCPTVTGSHDSLPLAPCGWGCALRCQMEDTADLGFSNSFGSPPISSRRFRTASRTAASTILAILSGLSKYERGRRRWTTGFPFSPVRGLP